MSRNRMDGQGREGYAGGKMTTGSIRESVNGRRVAITGGTNATWRVYDANGGSLPSSVLGLRYLLQGREYSWAIHAATGGTGLYNFRARHCDPQTGRWLSNDPIGISGGMNQYAFCANNPVMFVDPEGLWSKRDTAEHIVKAVEANKYIVAVKAVGNAATVPSPGAMDVYQIIDASVQTVIIAHVLTLKVELQNTLIEMDEARSPEGNARLGCWYKRVSKVLNILLKYYE